MIKQKKMKLRKINKILLDSYYNDGYRDGKDEADGDFHGIDFLFGYVIGVGFTFILYLIFS